MGVQGQMRLVERNWDQRCGAIPFESDRWGGNGWRTGHWGLRAVVALTERSLCRGARFEPGFLGPWAAPGRRLQYLTTLVAVGALGATWANVVRRVAALWLASAPARGAPILRSIEQSRPVSRDVLLCLNQILLPSLTRAVR